MNSLVVKFAEVSARRISLSEPTKPRLSAAEPDSRSGWMVPEQLRAPPPPPPDPPLEDGAEATASRGARAGGQQNLTARAHQRHLLRAELIRSAKEIRDNGY